jgi:hypothetical protein
MLALFAEGEALLRLIESGNIDQVIIEIPEWQAQVMTMTAKKPADLSDQQWEGQVKMLQEIAQRIAQALGTMSQALQAEMSAVQKQHSVAKAYMANS